jgi:hypothetical protein
MPRHDRVCDQEVGKVPSISANDVTNEKPMWYAITVAVTLHGDNPGTADTMAIE